MPAISLETKMRPPPEGFSGYNFSAPMDEEAMLRTARPVMVKGLALRSFVKEAEAQGKPLPGDPTYLAFKDYPFRESLQLSFRVARLLYPALPLPEALRRLGRRAYGSFLDSMVGRAMFGLPGMRIEHLMKLSPRAYAVLLSSCEVKLVSVTSDSALFSFRNFPIDLNAYEIGVFEGGFIARNIKCEVHLKNLSFGDADLFCTWQE
jgi:uncharacterized protein (TIGR02265 family)